VCEVLYVLSIYGEKERRERKCSIKYFLSALPVAPPVIVDTTIARVGWFCIYSHPIRHLISMIHLVLSPASQSFIID
jgi:hypothetical protein